MNEQTLTLFNQLLTAMSESYGVASVSQNFAATPSIAQELHDLIVESADFLKKINVMPVTELKGEKIFGSAQGVIGKRTNTDLNDRQTSDVHNLDTKGYECFKTEYDVHMKYATVDAWAKFKDFNQRYLKWVRHAIAVAKIRVGWRGERVELETNAITSPLGQDVNVGWLQLMREYNGGAHWLDEGNNAGEIRIGPGGDFPNLDSAVHECLQMVDPLFRESGDLRVFIGSDLLALDKAQLYVAQGQTPSEKERVENQAVTRTYGSLPVATEPFFPSRGLFITSYNNLSLYYQDTSVRRKVEDNAKRDRVEDYNSVNEGYVIEDERKAAGFEFANILIPDGAGGWAAATN